MPSAQMVVVVELPKGLLVASIGTPPDRAAGHEGDDRQAEAPIQASDPFPLDDLQTAGVSDADPAH